MTSNTLPLSFRAAEVDRIISLIQSGESCSLIGIGSVGKSKLLRFLIQDDLRRAKLGQSWDKYLFVYVDINKSLQKPEWGLDWGLYELMLHQILSGIKKHGDDSIVYKDIENLHERATHPETYHLALRYLERALLLVCEELHLHIVFLIDEFDRLCNVLPSKTFSALRSIRDDYKYRLMYVVASRKDIARIQEHNADIEAFEELVTPNTIWLMAYSENDAQLMLNRLAERYHVERLSEAEIKKILIKTGGHPGLMRAAFGNIIHKPVDLKDLKATDRLIREYQHIWHSLDEEEQRALANLAPGGKQNMQSDVMDRLQKKGLMGGSWAEPDEVFSQFLAEFILNEKPAIGAHIYIDHQKHLVFVDDCPVKGIANLEYKLLELLVERRCHVVSRDEIAQHLYPNDMVADGEGVADGRIDAVLKRLRKAIEPDADEPRYIITVRGLGVKLEDGIPLKSEKERTE
jgi:DNA-binding response OmpR family regulator